MGKGSDKRKGVEGAEVHAGGRRKTRDAGGQHSLPAQHFHSSVLLHFIFIDRNIVGCSRMHRRAITQAQAPLVGRTDGLQRCPHSPLNGSTFSLNRRTSIPRTA